MVLGSYVIISMALFQLSNTVLNSIGKLKEGAMSSMIGVTLKVISNFLLIPIAKININGAIIGLLLCNLVPMLINQRTIKKYIGTEKTLLESWREPTISSIVMGISVFISNKVLLLILKGIFGLYLATLVSLVVSVLIGVFIYVRTLIYTKALTNEYLAIVPLKVRRILKI